jgi:hypothetical protein
MLEFNFFNILPILLIEVIIVYIFEYLVFLYSIIPNTLRITTQVLSYTFYSYIYSNRYNHYINPQELENSSNNEKKYISTQKTSSILILSFMIVGILLLLLLYKYIVVNIYKINIDWFFVLIAVIGITLLIIFMECIYIFVIEDQAENDKNYYNYMIETNNEVLNHMTWQNS